MGSAFFGGGGGGAPGFCSLLTSSPTGPSLLFSSRIGSAGLGGGGGGEVTGFGSLLKVNLFAASSEYSRRVGAACLMGGGGDGFCGAWEGRHFPELPSEIASVVKRDLERFAVWELECDASDPRSPRAARPAERRVLKSATDRLAVTAARLRAAASYVAVPPVSGRVAVPARRSTTGSGLGQPSGSSSFWNLSHARRRNQAVGPRNLLGGSLWRCQANVILPAHRLRFR